MVLNVKLDDRLIKTTKLALDLLATRSSDRMQVAAERMKYANGESDFINQSQKEYLENLVLLRDCEAALLAMDQAK